MTTAFEKYLQDCVQETDPAWAKSCSSVANRLRAAIELHKALFGMAKLPDPKTVIVLYDRLLDGVYTNQIEPQVDELSKLMAERDAQVRQLTETVHEILTFLEAPPRIGKNLPQATHDRP